MCRKDKEDKAWKAEVGPVLFHPTHEVLTLQEHVFGWLSLL